MSTINELLANDSVAAASTSTTAISPSAGSMVDQGIHHHFGVSHPRASGSAGHPPPQQQQPSLLVPINAKSPTYAQQPTSSSSPYGPGDMAVSSMAMNPQRQNSFHQHHSQYHDLPPPPAPAPPLQAASHRSYQPQQQQPQPQPPQQPPPAPQSQSQLKEEEQQPPQQDVDEFLRRKRKAREHKACYPCRQRKVKCDLSRPCQTCRDRDHPELCSYHPPNKRQSVSKDNASSNTNGNTTLPKIESPVTAGTPSQSFLTAGRGDFDLLCSKLTGLENSIAELRREMRRNAVTSNPSSQEFRRASDASFNQSPGLSFQSPPANSTLDPNFQPRRPTHIDMHGFHTRNDAGRTVHVGASSIPAMLYALQSGDSKAPGMQDMLGKSALPLFGLDNHSAIYPFVDLWGIPAGSIERFQGIATALPADEQVRKYVHAYVTMGYVVIASIVNPEEFEREVDVFLRKRAEYSNPSEGVTEREIYGQSYTWLALLFAVLASGAQGSMVRRKEREVTSQVFICSSFECLRVTNFLSLADLESVQALVVIGVVLTNNMNAGTAWSFHGLTVRIAQSLGLHQACPPVIPSDKVFPRSKIWWSIIWLDSLLSIGYDRPSTAYLESANMPMPEHFGDVGAYHSAMYRMSRIALDIVRGRSLPMTIEEKYDWTFARRDDLSRMMADVAEHLRDLSKCSNQREEIEHWALYLHYSYNLAEAYRHAISPAANQDLANAFRQPCIDNLANTVEAYIGLNDITTLAKNSWAALQRGLSSALLLGILNEHTRSERALGLLTRFTAVLQDITDNVDVTEISAPVRRGLAALRRLRLSDSSNGVGENGLVKLENPMVITPASSDGNGFIGEETSPHSLLTSILWGQDSITL